MSNNQHHRVFRLAYDGRSYRGFQRQRDQPTIEGSLFTALERLGIDPLQADYAAAGRTDAGVSALAQTISLSVPDWLDPSALNGELPEPIRSWAATDVSDDFHPRYDATSRRYHYVCQPQDADLDRVKDACNRLVGTHDFRHLTPENERTTRCVQTFDMRRDDSFIVFEVEAPGFLRHQVRRMVTLVTEVGRGERSINALDDILAGDPLPGHRGIEPADPRFLVLTAVTYDDVIFKPDLDATERARQFFRGEADVHRGLGRVFQAVADGIE